jgi:hypothetical protein
VRFHTARAANTPGQSDGSFGDHGAAPDFDRHVGVETPQDL